MKSSSFNVENKCAKAGIAQFLKETFGKDIPVLVCIGTDAVIGDSLGPLVGSLLEEKLNGKTFIYGSFASPITAREIEPLVKFIKAVHPDKKVLAIDAAVGKQEEIGSIKLIDRPLKPGAGVEKNLSEIGDANVIGVMAEKCVEAGKLGFVRLSRVYRVAKVIVDGINAYILSATA